MLSDEVLESADRLDFLIKNKGFECSQLRNSLERSLSLLKTTYDLHKHKIDELEKL